MRDVDGVLEAEASPDEDGEVELDTIAECSSDAPDMHTKNYLPVAPKLRSHVYEDTREAQDLFFARQKVKGEPVVCGYKLGSVHADPK